jgi:hypothetical protein
MSLQPELIARLVRENLLDPLSRSIRNIDRILITKPLHEWTKNREKNSLSLNV